MTLRSKLIDMSGPARSRSDAELARRISECGVAVTPWQVERWRQHGLLPPAARSYPGRGQGSEAIYPPESVEQGRVVAQLVRRRRPLSDVAVALFVRGYPVPEQVLKDAFGEWLDRLQRYLGRPATVEEMFDSAEDRARAMVAPMLKTKQGRRFRSRQRGGDVAADDVFLSVVTNLVLLLQGGETTDDGLDEVLEAGGASAMYRDRIPGAGPIAAGPSPEVREFMRKVSLQNLRRLVEASTIEDLVWARDLILLFIPFASVFAVMIRTMFQLPDAMGFGVLADMEGDDRMLGYGIPIMLLLRDVASTPEAQDLLAMMRDKLVHFQQAAAFLRSFPAPVARRLVQGDAAVLDELDADERRRIQAEAARLQTEAESRGFSTSPERTPAPAPGSATSANAVDDHGDQRAGGSGTGDISHPDAITHASDGADRAALS